MNKILRKRLLRDLRANFGRYLALFLLFVLGLYLVVSIVGSSEMIIQGTENKKSVNMVEDGQFTVFLPLSADDLNSLTADGTTIEPMFSFDLKADDRSTLRLFRNRDKIDLFSWMMVKSQSRTVKQSSKRAMPKHMTCTSVIRSRQAARNSGSRASGLFRIMICALQSSAILL